MADPFRKVGDNDPFLPSAGLHNIIVEMAQWFRNQGGARGIGGRQATEQTGIIDCKNTSGGDLARFAALAIDSVFPDPSDNAVTFANGPILRGITPTASTDPGNFCVLLAPAKDDVIVRACASGVCVAKVNINDADDTTCGVDATTVLQSGKQGAQILWKESGTGEKWAVIRVGSFDATQFAKLDATLNAGSSCEASIWSGDPLADSGDNETVYDWFLESGMKLESGVKVMLTMISGKWYVTQSNTCPVDQ